MLKLVVAVPIICSCAYPGTSGGSADVQIADAGDTTATLDAVDGSEVSDDSGSADVDGGASPNGNEDDVGTAMPGQCQRPIDLSGTYIMGAAVAVDPTKPLRFKLVLAVDLAASTIAATLQAIAVPPNNGVVAPGTLVGEVYPASSPLDAGDGSFALDFGTIEVPVEAVPIIPSRVTATLVLEGCTSTATSSCGTVQGDISFPAAIPLAGSTWAIVPLPDGVDASAQTLETACPE